MGAAGRVEGRGVNPIWLTNGASFIAVIFARDEASLIDCAHPPNFDGFSASGTR